HYRAAEFWLKEIGVDGFRLDAVRYFYEIGEALQDTEETRQWLKAFTEHCHAVNPAAFVIGENTARMNEVARSIRGDSVDSSFEFDLARAVLESVRLRTPAILSNALARLDETYEGQTPWATLLTNHDQERARTQLGGSDALTRLATKLLFTLPGVPFLYYGEELGMQATKPDPELRTPMPWTAEPPNAGFTAREAQAWKAPQPEFVDVNVAAQTSDPDSMLTLYRRLIRLNASSPALRYGKAIEVTTNHRAVYAQMRQTDREVVLVLGNFGETPLHDVHLTVEESVASDTWTLSEALEGEEIAKPALTERGGFQQWRPLAELAPESIYVLRWRR
ncbi:MAG TPA: alpha-amylase family glycosyl hydrolase, partial [Opitutus sp.]|nr:alpha-amylase family glycosyl hydrolase [Opitutus sp.]